MDILIYLSTYALGIGIGLLITLIIVAIARRGI